jgi:hypothetical protein
LLPLLWSALYHCIILHLANPFQVENQKILATIDEGGGWGKRVLPKLHDLVGGGGSAGGKAKTFRFMGATIEYGEEAGNESFEAGPDPLVKIAAELTEQNWLLCFDEFQVTDIADALILGRLLDALEQNGAVLIITSNRAPK